MAKKVIEEVNVDNYTERLIKEIAKKYGEGVAVGADAIIESDKVVIPVSPALDPILNGGIPEGSWFVLTGPPKYGKTTLALHFAANCQMDEYGGRHVYYMNVEGRLKKMNIEGIPKLRKDRLTVITSTEERAFTSHEYLDIAENILRTHRKCVLIIDSMSALSDAREVEGGIGTKTRGSINQDVSQFCRDMANIVPFKDSIVISITHQIANTSGYGPARMEKAANALKYQTDVKLNAKSCKPWVVGQSTKPIGQEVEWECLVSALGSPGDKCTSYIRYGIGIDEAYEVIDIGSACGLISKAGAWYTCDFMENNLDILGVEKWDEKLAKFQGQDNLRNHLVDNPKWMEVLKKSIKEMLG